MPHFASEPALPYSQQNQTAVLLLNLGTPDAPTTEAVRAFLKDFLSDPRVVELPRWLWQPILRCAILPFRPKKSAHGYAKIWLDEGSPLALYTKRLSQALGDKLHGITVRHAMTYGKPAVSDVLSELKAQGVEKILVIPLYPQYAASSTGAALDKIFAALAQQRNQMSVRTVSRFYDDAGYIDAMKQHIQAYWAEHGRGEKLLLSFHGIPQKNHDDGDPYADECRHTAQLLAEALSLGEKDYIVSFQSRFGRSKWVEPSTQDLLENLPSQDVAKLDVFCPGFISDCLETLEEIALVGREQFHAAGGKQYQYIPCLNADALWLEALADLARRNLAGWV